MNDDSALGTVQDCLATAKDSLAEVHMSTPLDAIVRHGRAARRRHRLKGLAGAGAVAVAAVLAAGLAGVAGSGPAHHAATIRTASFTLVSHADGTATLTINPLVLLNPAVLQSDLRRDGIRAIVREGSYCSSHPVPAGFAQVVSFYPRPQGSVRSTPVADPTVTFHPAAMPAGTELSFGNFQLATRQQTTFALIDASSYTCIRHVPRAPDAMTLIYERPAS